MRLAIQLYTLRALERTLPETISKLEDTPYEGVQFAGLWGSTPDHLVEALAESDLDVAGAHVGIDEIEDAYDETVDTYGTLGCDQLVIPSYDRAAFEDADGAREAGEHLGGLATRLGEDGIGLHYHNHTFEFTGLGSETAFDVFATTADGVGLEIDTGLASHAGVDPVGLLERYGDRVDLVHLTDSRPGADDTLHVDLGTGEVDIEACVEAARDAGVEWLVFEHGLTDHPLESMADAGERLADLL